jgi:multiple sugar transport system permease protein
MLRAANLWKALAFLVVVGLAALFVFPMIWMGITSLKSVAEVYADPVVWWPHHLIFHNFVEAWHYFPFLHDALNTAEITIPFTVGTTVSSAFVAYGFGVLAWRGREVTFYVVLATMMIPTWVTIVPLYILFNKIGWVDTFKPLVVPAFFGDPFSIFLLRQFFRRLPRDLINSARIDGASHLRIFMNIVVPISKPALAVVALFAFVYGWTDFFNPLVYLSSPSKNTLQLGLLAFFSHYYVNWPGYMAGSVMVLLPVMILFAATQKTFIEGITFQGLRQ